MRGRKTTEEKTDPRSPYGEDLDGIQLTPIPDGSFISGVEISTLDGPAGVNTGRRSTLLPGPPLPTPVSTGSDRKRRPSRTSDEVDTGVWDGRPRGFNSGALTAGGNISGRYEVMGRVGTGGMAQIYKVRHLSLGKEFALKVIDQASEAAQRIQQLFFREARVAGVMDHPNIVQVVDFGVDDTLGAYIVMEYLRGETLHARLRRDRILRLGTALEIGLQIAEALHYMHSQDVIHCDIKAENIFLCPQREEQRQRLVVKLIDFGLARTKTTGVRLARTEVAGTPQYMAPELIHGRSPQPSMDIYSLGVLFYEMLSGRMPFTGSMEEVLSAQLFTKPEPLSKVIAEGIDERVESFVMKSLSKDPTLRQASMGQVIFELRTLMEMLSLRDPRGRRGHAAREPEGRVDYKVFFEQCPCPMFLLDAETKITLANAAFGEFVCLPTKEVVGTAIARTRLGNVYPGIAEDLANLIRAKRTRPFHRVLSYDQGDGQVVSIVCWLTPEAGEHAAISRFRGFIHPLGTHQEAVAPSASKGRRGK